MTLIVIFVASMILHSKVFTKTSMWILGFNVLKLHASNLYSIYFDIIINIFQEESHVAVENRWL